MMRCKAIHQRNGMPSNSSLRQRKQTARLSHPKPPKTSHFIHTYTSFECSDSLILQAYRREKRKAS
jgi:hypothetical protein